MAKKNGPKETMGRENEQREQAAEPQRANPYVEARIDRLVNYESSNVRAVASANIGGAFAIHDIQVMDSQNGLFVKMPSKSFQRNGNTEYRDLFHPITAQARNELFSKVLKAYDEKLAEVEAERMNEGQPNGEDETDGEDEGEDETLGDDEDEGFVQGM